MEILGIKFYRNKKELWFLLLLVGLIGFLVSPFSESTPGFLYALSEGSGTELNGYEIHTGLRYTYHRNEYLGGVSVSKFSSDFKSMENDYHLSFNEGADKEIEKLNDLCSRVLSSCESISFEGYEGIGLSTYIESIDEIINRTVYFNHSCDIYLSHTGTLFDWKYIEIVERFFNDNCKI